MITSERISQQSPIFLKNISTLRQRQPILADRLCAVPIPDTIQITTGRDGSPVLVLSVDEDRIDWLGGSSMPSISAPQALNGFVDQGVNVALPSIGTGYECLHLLDLLQPHCAVFVCEQSTERLTAALAAIDYAAHLASGRLLLLDGDIEQTLPEFIDENPGYDFPTQLFALPDLNVNAFKVRTDSVHRACHVANDRQQAQIRRLIDHRKPANKHAKPHIAVVSVDATGGAVEHADRIGRAVEALSWTYSVSVPDHPQSCSLFARVHAVSESGVDLVININGTPGRLTDHLPDDVPTVCWFMDSATLPSVALDGMTDATQLVAASVEVRNVLVAHGANPDNIRVIAKGVDHVLFGSETRQAPRRDAVLVLVDGEDLDPATAHIGLESHGRLWMEMQQAMSAATDRKKRLDVSAMLSKAERETGVRLSDDELRQQFLTIVTQKMTKTILAKTAIEAVSRHEFHVELYGLNWAKHATVVQFHKGAIPDARDRAKLLKHCGCILIPFADAVAVQHCLEAVASGCLPVLRNDGSEFFDRYPRAKAILQTVPQYGTNTELLACIQRWSSRTRERDELVMNLRTQLLTDQKTSDRLKEIRAWACG